MTTRFGRGVRIQRIAIALGLALLLGAASGCVSPKPAAPETSSDAAPETTTTAPKLPKQATKPPPPRPRPVFAAPPRSFDPLLIGAGSHDLFDPTNIEFRAICCPIHGTPLPVDDPLLK